MNTETTSNELNDIPPFEGPEKKIEVDFLLSSENPKGLRVISIPDWEVLLKEINCTILSKISNESCDAYILSESSLFVFSEKVIIKTCGQITLLKCLPLLVEYGKKSMAVETRVSFSRRNLLFPDEQYYPHKSFDEEVRYLKQHFPSGDAYVFGPHNCDHHYMFVYHNEKLDLPKTKPSFEILMTGLNERVMRQFYRDENFVSVEETTRRSRIQSLFNDSTMVDAHAFEPLGFSLNSLDGTIYSTLHITPQPECSYVSFETNFVPEKYHELVEKVIDIFKPECFTILVVSDGVPFDSDCFSNFYSRGLANHNFVGTGNTLSWFSFRKLGTVSPTVSSTHLLNPNILGWDEKILAGYRKFVESEEDFKQDAVEVEVQ